MRLIYVIAPYRAQTVWGVHCNIQDAEGAASQLWRMGYAVLCPHKNSAYFDGVVSDDQFLAAGLEMLRRCDCVVIAGDISHSAGSQSEVDEAVRLGISVYTTLHEAAQHAA